MASKRKERVLELLKGTFSLKEFLLVSPAAPTGPQPKRVVGASGPVVTDPKTGKSFFKASVKGEVETFVLFPQNKTEDTLIFLKNVKFRLIGLWEPITGKLSEEKGYAYSSVLQLPGNQLAFVSTSNEQGANPDLQVWSYADKNKLKLVRSVSITMPAGKLLVSQGNNLLLGTGTGMLLLFSLNPDQLLWVFDMYQVSGNDKFRLGNGVSSIIPLKEKEKVFVQVGTSLGVLNLENKTWSDMSNTPVTEVYAFLSQNVVNRTNLLPLTYGYAGALKKVGLEVPETLLVLPENRVIASYAEGEGKKRIELQKDSKGLLERENYFRRDSSHLTYLPYLQFDLRVLRQVFRRNLSSYLPSDLQDEVFNFLLPN